MRWIIHCPMGTMRMVIPLQFPLLFLLSLLLLLIVIYDCGGTYDKAIIMDWYVGHWWCWITMSTYFLNLLSCPCPSVPPRIIITLLFRAYKYKDNAVDCFIWWCHVGTDELVHTDDSVTTIHVMSLSVLYVRCDE